MCTIEHACTVYMYMYFRRLILTPPLFLQTDLDLVTRGLNMAKVTQRRQEKLLSGNVQYMYMYMYVYGPTIMYMHMYIHVHVHVLYMYACTSEGH